jgi:hypothetical protein
VDCGYILVGRGYNGCVGASDFVEGRGGTAAGEEAAFYFGHVVVTFWVNVVSSVGAGFYLFQFIRGGRVEEVMGAFLTLFVLNGIGGHI